MNESKEKSEDLAAAPAEPSATSLNFDEIIASMNEQRLRIRPRLATNREILLLALKEIGATNVVVYYSGSGDSGQIDEVVVKSGDQPVKSDRKVSISIAKSFFAQGRGWVENIDLQEMSLEAALEQFVYDWTESEHPGWENNDGASGACSILVKDDEFSLQHITYYTESETTEHYL